MENKYRFVIGIDPSINYCGFSVFELVDDNYKLVVSKLLEPGRTSKEFTEKSKDIYNTVKSVYSKLSDEGSSIIILEIPQYWALAGFIARESGSIYKLTFLCGMIYSLPNVIVVTPNEYKGQLPKEVVRNRLEKIYPQVKTMNHNVVDAIYLGYWFIFEKGCKVTK